MPRIAVRPTGGRSLARLAPAVQSLARRLRAAGAVTLRTPPLRTVSARVLAVLAYTGALRLPLDSWLLPQWPVPDWLYTVPGGLLLAGGLWAWARGRSPFLAHHGRAGLLWALQVNLLLTAISLFSRVCYDAWFRTGVPLVNQVWHLAAEVYRWTAVLCALLTFLAMVRAAKGQTGDPLGLPL
ncbi:MAG: hypothetical protein AB2385_01375 [Symbiobacterium sp.]|uniref:hypothetical protein n=1 Tax=Symbiobacterium sp. TaxID=1971213 RepID=UPI003464D756